VRFLDTNIILRYLTRDDAVKAEACFALFQQIQRGEEEVFTCEAIVAEAVYVLTSPRLPYGLSHEEVHSLLLPILMLRGLHLPQKQVVMDALDLYAASHFLDFEDALAVTHMKQQGCGEILSYDRGFDRVSGIARVEP